MDEDNPYQSPKDTSTGPGPTSWTMPLGPAVGKTGRSWDFAFVVIQNSIFMVLSALPKDGGFFLQLCLAIVIWYWIVIALIVMRHRAVADLARRSDGPFWLPVRLLPGRSDGPNRPHGGRSLRR